MATLKVCVDHIATLRQARSGKEPDPVQAALISELAGASGISAHLRNDRRHIQDKDVYLLKQVVTTELDLTMAATADTVAFAVDVLPHMVTLVPEKPEERTTEGGLPVRGNEKELGERVATLRNHGITVCLFVDPDIQQIKAARRVGATHIQLSTLAYANALGHAQTDELESLREAAFGADKLDLTIAAGGGLNYRNAAGVADLDNVEQLVVGHAVVARAALVGLDVAVRDMLGLI